MQSPLPRIDPEFKALIPPLSPEEYAQLEQNILAGRKCRDAIVVWRDTIVDGHNRVRICAAHGIPFEIKEMHFESRSEAMLWILDNQLGRRNLTDAMRIELAMSKNQLLKAQGKERQIAGGQHKSRAGELFSLSSKMENNPINVSRTAAKEAGVSDGTFHHYQQILKHGSPQLIEAVKSGKLKIKTAYRLLDSQIAKELKQADKMYSFIEKNLHKVTDPGQLQEIQAGLAGLQEQLKTIGNLTV